MQERLRRCVDDRTAMVGAIAHDLRTPLTRPAAREGVELNSLVESVVADMAETGFDAAFEGGNPLVVQVDPLGMRRAVTNLVVNACRYGTWARARVRREGARAVVEVADDGPGLPAGKLDRVFKPFYRAERSRSRATGGTGLGLAVVLAHGGEATLENLRDGGLRARITLPL